MDPDAAAPDRGEARDAETGVEECLVDDGWKVFEVSGNGLVIGVGPSVELALGNEHTTNGKGNHEAAAAVAVLLGGIHGRGAGAGEGLEPEA